MRLLIDGLRLAEMAGRAGRNNNSQQQQDAPPPGSTPPPAAADCSREAATLDGLTEEELQQFGQAMLEEACQFIDRFSVLPSRGSQERAGPVRRVQLDLPLVHRDPPHAHHRKDLRGRQNTGHGTHQPAMPQPPDDGQDHRASHLPHHSRAPPAPLDLDEADALLGTGQRAEDIRGILNAGYKYNGVITRVVKSEATDFSVFCPVMFAGKGDLPKSLMDRSISIMMAKRKPGQKMDRFIPKMHDAMGRKIGLMLGAWATKIQGPAGDILWDDPPGELEDRQVDILTPLYAFVRDGGWGAGRLVSLRLLTC